MVLVLLHDGHERVAAQGPRDQVDDDVVVYGDAVGLQHLRDEGIPARVEEEERALAVSQVSPDQGRLGGEEPFLRAGDDQKGALFGNSPLLGQREGSQVIPHFLESPLQRAQSLPLSLFEFPLPMTLEKAEGLGPLPGQFDDPVGQLLLGEGHELLLPLPIEDDDGPVGSDVETARQAGVPVGVHEGVGELPLPKVAVEPESLLAVPDECLAEEGVDRDRLLQALENLNGLRGEGVDLSFRKIDPPLEPESQEVHSYKNPQEKAHFEEKVPGEEESPSLERVPQLPPMEEEPPQEEEKGESRQKGPPKPPGKGVPGPEPNQEEHREEREDLTLHQAHTLTSTAGIR